MKGQKQMVQHWSRFPWVLAVILVCICLLPMQSYADAPEPEQIIYEGPAFTENEVDAYPKEVLEQNGKRYQRVFVKTKPTEKKGTLTYVSTVVPCQLEGKQMPPEQATITLFFDITGEEYQRDVSLQEVREKNVFWKSDFSFPITVWGYGAEVFYLGDYEVPGGTDLMEYTSYFLEYLELPQECYRIERIEWNGECYEKEGIYYRDAVAYGEKLIREVEAVYGGQVRTPNIPAKQYVAVYEEIIEPEAYKETVPAELETSQTMKEVKVPSESMLDTQEEEGSFLDNVFRRLKESITVVVFSSLFLICVGVGVLFVWFAGRDQEGRKADRGK